ncbi:lytic transglycosylase domain-containing protein, partial [Brucella melitensis]|uniref:transglycosylase SLT domain-containing protein n=1 Tax=Brucella melitensis TaxID=29459 RepID=UPI001AA01D99|nr:lytic transglycosylase domain-containing protein [Brucella melitensis]
MALSLGSPPPGVTRHRVSLEPGLSSPATNIQFGMKYLAMAQKLGGGSTCGTILKYNAGHGAKRMNPT